MFLVIKSKGNFMQSPPTIMQTKCDIIHFETLPNIFFINNFIQKIALKWILNNKIYNISTF